MGRVRNFGNKAQGMLYFGGANPTVDDDAVTIGVSVFRIVTAEGDEGAGEIPVVKGVAVANTVAALLAAINANPPAPGIVASADPVATTLGIRLIAENPGENGNVDLVVEMTDVLNIGSDDTLVGGVNPGNRTLHSGEYVVTDADVAAASVVIETGLAAPINVQAEVRRSGDLVEALTNLQTVSGSKIKYDATGGTDLAAGDKISWSAWE